MDKYTPEDGLKNTVAFPTEPADETAARKQVQDMLDQMLVFHNTHLAETVSYQTRVSKAIATLDDINNVDQTIPITLPIEPKSMRINAVLASGGAWQNIVSLGEYAQNAYGVCFGTGGNLWLNQSNKIVCIGNVYEIIAIVKSVSATSIVLTWSYTGTPPSGANTSVLMLITAVTH